MWLEQPGLAATLEFIPTATWPNKRARCIAEFQETVTSLLKVRNEQYPHLGPRDIF